MPTFNWAPSAESQMVVKPRILQAKFGDGYTQEAPDGINHLLRTWQVYFKNRTTTECDAIEAFLVAQAGYLPFDWTPPNGAAGKWKCGLPNGWTRTRHSGQVGSITCTFEEVPQ